MQSDRWRLRDWAAVSILSIAGVTASAQTQPAAEPATEPVPTSDETAASAESTGSATADWRIEVTAWIWVMGLEGDVGVRGRSASVDASFADLLDDSDSILAFSGRLEIGSGRVAGFVDGFYADLGVDDTSGPLGLADIDVSFQEAVLDFGTMFRVVDSEPSGHAAKNSRNFTLDLYGGGRYVSIDLELDPANAASQSDSIDWIDPIFGAKVVVPIAEHWHLAVNGDVGGFGVASDFTWSATAVVGYNFRLFDHPASAMLGYRAIGWDYTSDGSSEFEWDIIQHGVILGFGMRF